MSDFSDYADQLQREVVSEMAEGYFGERRNLDDMITDFYAMADELRQQIKTFAMAAARLHHLLLDRPLISNFYLELGVDPVCIPFADDAPVPMFGSLPFALTGAGRYVRCVRKAYDLFQKAVHEYLHGKYYEKAGEKGRKRMTVSYLGLREFASRINDEVLRVNRNRTPTDALRYVKGLDPSQAERERIIGDVSYVDGGCLDVDLGFVPVDFDGLGLPEVQDLAPLFKVKSEISRMCRAIHHARSREAGAAMLSLVMARDTASRGG
ncbi:MAG: hypothetical protein KUA35_13380 [Pseudodesulfovibrio sp.]|uniref:Uncharacterized protein n=1 Tax=Pseudodesulfovibrio aespoeensis (strain ATCC 700646 / DSM 10631 / Aspo-2) TaxID=643562 RepID=E6VXZ0_PSEA9|nr:MULTISPECIES: hypothetical protein [Pseudodesulfovibrio]MBU4191285.1 hypothetical protein [Pseudomonadota bacterium]ADU62697.1 hypothetical protein Daes_1685 [Pseudodesulfovibrio aespoeensis Aspo-2]MBU4245040.1 hypothetical protein [Pseudomonadota bacterium]MBU4377518.1 hypothetical protein [Pseudomonadota bacterium]MBU4474328.1 hypothetical protein [Pseudomonadota bacterium]